MFNHQSNEPRLKPSAIKRKALDPIKNRNEGYINTSPKCNKQFGNNHSQMNLVKSSNPNNNSKRGILPRRLQENLESIKRPQTPPPHAIRQMRTSQSQSHIPRLMKYPTNYTSTIKSSPVKLKIIKNVVESSKLHHSLTTSPVNKSSQVEETHCEELKEIPSPIIKCCQQKHARHAEKLKEIPLTKNKSDQCARPDSKRCDNVVSAKLFPEFSGIDVISQILCDVIKQLNLKKAEQNIMKNRLPGFYMALPNFQGSVLTAFRSPNKILQFAWFRTTDYLAQI